MVWIRIKRGKATGDNRLAIGLFGNSIDRAGVAATAARAALRARILQKLRSRIRIAVLVLSVIYRASRLRSTQLVVTNNGHSRRAQVTNGRRTGGFVKL